MPGDQESPPTAAATIARVGTVFDSGKVSPSADAVHDRENIRDGSAGSVGKDAKNRAVPNDDEKEVVDRIVADVSAAHDHAWCDGGDDAAHSRDLSAGRNRATEETRHGGDKHESSKDA
jgi:hypothetical protein